MEAAQLRQLLSRYDDAPRALVDAFNDDILPSAVDALNRTVSVRQISKLVTERLPQNERNLTDARTRLGVLLEYALATVINAEWQQKLGGEYALAFVVANRYPDLVSRDRSHRPGVRIEVKAIEAVSEEKSANLDVLMRDTRNAGDILCVLVWEWRVVKEGDVVIEYPHIYKAFAFAARTIAKIRDTAWLRDMSRAKFKGIDVGGPVVGSQDGVKEEEHNMGKLLRIGSEDIFADTALAPYKDDSDVCRYREFRQFTITLGIQTIASRAFTKFGMKLVQGNIDDFRFVFGDSILVAIGRNNGKTLAIFGGTSRGNKIEKAIEGALNKCGCDSAYVLVFGEKFTWFLSRYHDGKYEKLSDPDKKPARAMKELGKHITPVREVPADTIG